MPTGASCAGPGGRPTFPGSAAACASSRRAVSLSGDDDADPLPRDRQLRLVHVQPGPVPGRARRRSRRRPQRPGLRRRAARARVRPRDRLAGALHAERGGHLARGRPPLPRGRRADARRLPRPPVARTGVRRRGHPPRPRPRQDHDDRARRADDLRRPAVAADGRALPLARRGRGRGARRVRRLRPRRRRGDGDPPPRAARRGRPVPPRVGADRVGQAHARELPARAGALSPMPNDILTRAIDALASGHDLPREQAGAALGEIMRGDASESQIAAFLIALRTKGETVDELAGLGGTMRALATPVPCDRGDLVDTAGTGGGKPTFNVSTTAAGARRKLIGVSDPNSLERMAGALARLGCDRALLVSSEDGLDEMSTSAPTHVVEVNGEDVRRYVVSPADVGIEPAPFDAVRGGTPDENAQTTRAILAGENGARRDIAVLNAGAAIYAGGIAT